MATASACPTCAALQRLVTHLERRCTELETQLDRNTTIAAELMVQLEALKEKQKQPAQQAEFPTKKCPKGHFYWGDHCTTCPVFDVCWRCDAPISSGPHKCI